MDKLKQELKNSERYELYIHDDRTYDFIPHKRGMNILFIKEEVEGTNKKIEYIEIIVHDSSMPEGYVAMKIWKELTLEKLEKILDVI